MSLFQAAGSPSGAETEATRKDSSAEAMQRLREPFAVPPAESGDEPEPEPGDASEPESGDDSGRRGSTRKKR
jgi:hypothetical protein